jgi:hypothetical protein
MTDKVYTVRYLDGTNARVSSQRNYGIGEECDVKISSKKCRFRCVSDDVLLEVRSSMWGDWFQLVLILGAFLISVWYISFISIEPDSAVLRAAQTLSPNPIIDRGRVELLRCGKGDRYSFDVSDSIKGHVGYVCLGDSFSHKGATARFD